MVSSTSPSQEPSQVKAAGVGAEVVAVAEPAVGPAAEPVQHLQPAVLLHFQAVRLPQHRVLVDEEPLHPQRPGHNQPRHVC